MGRISGRSGIQKVMWRGERGASMVEFAIVLPLLLLLVFGIIEFSLLLYDQAIITNASREGARFAALYDYDPATKTYGKSTAEICDVIEGYVQNHLITFNNGYSFSCNQNVPNKGTKEFENGAWVRRVTIQYPYQFLVFPKFATGILGTMDLSAEAVMRDEDQEH